METEIVCLNGQITKTIEEVSNVTQSVGYENDITTDINFEAFVTNKISFDSDLGLTKENNGCS